MLQELARQINNIFFFISSCVKITNKTVPLHTRLTEKRSSDLYEIIERDAVLDKYLTARMNSCQKRGKLNNLNDFAGICSTIKVTSYVVKIRRWFGWLPVM